MTKLAIDGGQPVKATMLPYARQAIDEDDRLAVEDVLRSDWLTTGPKIKEFEAAVANYTGANEAAALSTGTAALHAAIWAAGVGPGDEVIVPAISFVASANCVLYVGAKPVFADLSPDTLNIDPADVLRKITSRTKAIVVVDFAGHPCDHDVLRRIADQHGLTIIEDAAHSLGASYKGRKVGTLQDVTTLSFHPVKHVTTGEGGMVLTDDVNIAKRVRSFRHHGIDLDLHARNKTNSWEYDVVDLGYNYRLPDINCALGISQLAKSERWLLRRREIVDAYNSALQSLAMLHLPVQRDDCLSAWHLYIVRLNLETVKVSRSEIFAALRAENIGVNVHYIPIPWMTYYANLGYKRGQWPVAELEYERMISLPIYPSMSDKDIADVVTAINKVWTNYQK
ncbi:MULTISPECIES: UDP-4-amino-4,6-dideoxy-N-acetyl-beta-L-altrosamine transaminase [Methylomonas]|uniref:UDP-4-amino-4, 6-dideoxy-N-acetyl-beta-L-altrosamine transaminase n=2 Tax=Methylomonas TaxID=416 RepID=A0A140E3Y8_9GAMM|nr:MULTISPECIES: UDP-4-amino-4,6-dideoxy-N-acetyl-beta-L-altrosamine transaminase [Methylomonas]AMK75112.1 UDP-4-amino-4,6-dideoxy-N-acetyl-beta-L-altrosamine transaminase [Methylomonas denitrificans]OAI02602.1 UDP-4-amino-4,6-dideoxy-N-acetyl-beta-L-altrosamine transaminase [Methylomonas methanica]TCV83072.1 UDP-4-amino-4,6-dideoxy-N-acetyl-beta-L-altrosamine transaminase [Methylomonas methanica]